MEMKVIEDTGAIEVRRLIGGCSKVMEGLGDDQRRDLRAIRPHLDLTQFRRGSEVEECSSNSTHKQAFHNLT
jgi:hypothetical protein